MIENQNLTFVNPQSVRRAIISELRENGIQEWADVAGRQIADRLIARHRGLHCTTEAPDSNPTKAIESNRIS